MTTPRCSVACRGQAQTAGQDRRAACLWGAAEALTERRGRRSHPYYQPDHTLYERTRAAVRAQLGEQALGAGVGRRHGHDLGAGAGRGRCAARSERWGSAGSAAYPCQGHASGGLNHT